MTIRKTNRLLPLTDCPALRPWQARCIEQALQTLSDTHPHFLCQATPGAGKMLMAAVLADELMQSDAIDLVIYLGPTTAVVERAQIIFEQITGRAMHGRLGAAGAAFTYHALHHRLAELQQLSQQGRVLLVWDESHHAASHTGNMAGANQWGLGLLALERLVRFTLALSGTPWRSDGSCLPLLRYMESTRDDGPSEDDQDTATQQHQLVPDFVYSLQEAIVDRVCRYPRVHLIDNRDIQLSTFQPKEQQRATHHYASIPHLLRHPAVSYSALLRHTEPLAHVLSLGCQRLAQLRQHDPDAAGLVVASDIAHAEDLAEHLEDLGHTVCLVTSKSPNAHARLNAFRDAQTPWIVSVGMVSEGVDIPRLRVCCYLSHVRTEQYFRQVLGRIIRREDTDDADCYLYALNEPYLRRYARRITDDLPDDLASVTLGQASHGADARRDYPGHLPDDEPDASHLPPVGENDDVYANPEIEANPSSPEVQLSMGGDGNHSIATDPDLAFSQAFIARLVALRLPSS
ncbi:DEAD/DEAH box helicase [Halomonas sp. I5-271120]|uniref:DEAD/DEAH box helicase n=1 Tax=Halomonas sp. I5-271120 TaxID=3061632 RepID=UPI00271465B7|nr:DEAD/DEAH box helicase family protein [Halomonas sp. I5-271120]